ncbi:MAG: hypothetical protein LBT78_11595, partial [Tannerella sp.]|nr:hypothetical protein [Tannerella sp.]
MTAIGAIFGLLVAIALILKKFNTAYSLILGAFIGGIVGGKSFAWRIFYRTHFRSVDVGGDSLYHG